MNRGRMGGGICCCFVCEVREWERECVCERERERADHFFGVMSEFVFRTDKGRKEGQTTR